MYVTEGAYIQVGMGGKMFQFWGSIFREGGVFSDFYGTSSYIHILCATTHSARMNFHQNKYIYISSKNIEILAAFNNTVA